MRSDKTGWLTDMFNISIYSSVFLTLCPGSASKANETSKRSVLLLAYSVMEKYKRADSRNDTLKVTTDLRNLSCRVVEKNV